MGKGTYALENSGKVSKAPWAISLGKICSVEFIALFMKKCLGYKKDEEYIHQCTGSIITESIVITAAHCTLEIDKLLYIKARTLNLKKLDSVERRLIKTIPHPEYKDPKVYFDVALGIVDRVVIKFEAFS